MQETEIQGRPCIGLPCISFQNFVANITILNTIGHHTAKDT